MWLGAACVVAAVGLGGVWPPAVALAGVLVAAAAFRERPRWGDPAPRGALIALLVLAWSTAASLPWPRVALGAALGGRLEHLDSGAGLAWSTLSAIPTETQLLTGGLCIALAAALISPSIRWRGAAQIAASCAALITAIGLAQYAVGSERVLGIYLPVERTPGHRIGMLSTFINPNHQSALLLLGLSSSLALFALSLIHI